MPAAICVTTGYQVLHELVEAVPDPPNSLVQVDAPEGTFIVNTFLTYASNGLAIRDEPGLGVHSYVLDGDNNIVGVKFLPSPTSYDTPYNAYLVCIGR